MANRVMRQMQEARELEKRLTYETHPEKRFNISRELKKIIHNLFNFGMKNHLVKITLEYMPLKEIIDGIPIYDNIQTGEVYLTDCTTEEAHTYVYELRFKKHKIIRCQIDRMPVGSIILKPKKV